MNVLYLHQYFATRAGAGGTRSYEFARQLTERGDAVTMVAAPRQAGGIGAGRRQQVDGIDVILVGSRYSNHLGPARRARAFARFTWDACRLRERDLPARPDVVVATSTPLTIGIPGVILARRFGVPFVFEVRDLWPQALVELGALRNPLLIRIARRLERWIYRRADRIVALSPGMADGVVAAGGDRRMLTMIPNGSDTELFTPQARDRTLLEPWGIADRFVAIHAGSMGAANGLEHPLRAMAELQRRGEDDVHLLIVGDGGTRPRLEALVRELGLTNVTFAGQIPRRELGAIVASVDVAITSFADLPILATNSPNKLFDGLAAGVPNIVNSAGWTRDLVLESDAGTFVDPRRPAELADALVALRDDADLRARQGRNARDLALRRFERGLLASQFAAVLDDAVGRPSTAGPDRAAETETARA